MASKRHSGFKRGSGCFKCSCCGKLTRDIVSNTTCEVCYEAGGMENEHSDYGHPEKLDDCPTCQGLECMHEAHTCDDACRSNGCSAHA